MRKTSSTIQIEPAVLTENFQSGSFGELLNTLIEEKLESSQMRDFSLISQIYERALIAARSNDLEKTRAHLNEAELAHFKFPVASLIYSVLDLHALPVRAYYHYKMGDFNLAENCLNKSITGSSALIEAGFYMVECHRIQQLHNLARMYFRRREFEHGSSIISEALNYMTHEEIPQIYTGWSVDALRRNPVSLRSNMILQLALETAGELLPPTQQQISFQRSAFGSWPESVLGLTICEPLARWVKIKDLLLTGMSDERFVESAVEFLMAAPAKFDILKLTLIVNVTEILKKRLSYDAGIYQDLVTFGEKLKVSQRYKLACFNYLQP